jgi:hypothetical protein
MMNGNRATRKNGGSLPQTAFPQEGVRERVVFIVVYRQRFARPDGSGWMFVNAQVMKTLPSHLYAVQVTESVTLHHDTMDKKLLASFGHELPMSSQTPKRQIEERQKLLQGAGFVEHSGHLQLLVLPTATSTEWVVWSRGLLALVLSPQELELCYQLIFHPRLV